MKHSPAVSIAGIGQTAFTKDSGRTVLALCAEASLAAINDAGIEPDEIDGLVTFTYDTTEEITLQSALGLPNVRWTSRAPFGGTLAYSVLQLAGAAIESGAASNILIYRAFNERSESRFGQPNSLATRMEMEERNFHRTFGLTTPAQVIALWYRPYLDHHGITSEDLGRYVVQVRAYAATNPNAWFYGRPITLDDHQSSKWIVEPVLRKLDCCQESDGGVAFVVSSSQRSRRTGRPGVRILAAEQHWALGNEVHYNFYRPDMVRQEQFERLADAVWEASGVSRSDIDVAMIYDAFSPVSHAALEGFGFCGPGQARDLIRAGGLALDGALPVNTNGGLLGEGYIHGMNSLAEAVRQLRGESPNQVKGASKALVTTSHSAAILASE
jgi:acetyl-CoA acetyltransferase